MDESQRDRLREQYLHGENPFRDNPYAPPEIQGEAMRREAVPYPPGPGMVRQVPVVAILMIVQGGLEVLMGLLSLGMGIFVPWMMRMDLQQQEAGMDEGGLEVMTWFMTGWYGGIGLLTLIAAGLHIAAGLFNYRYRRRTLGIVALIGGMVTLFTCYCALTAIALAVYGLVVYLNPPVAQAFAMGQAGHSKEKILAAFGA